jgi:protein-S-isoprenylcysteine O-methyltransferase Ste14
MEDKKHCLGMDVISLGLTMLPFAQIVVGIYLLPGVSQIELVAYAGVGLYIFAGLIFGMLPVFEFRRNGEVPTGKSYMHTKKLVDTGIYAIVRHPQFLTWILWAIAGMLIFQHWIVIVLGIPVIVMTYYDLLRADKRLIHKFGNEYRGL